MAEVKNMLHRVQHLFLSTSVSAQSCSGGGGGEWKDGRKGKSRAGRAQRERWGRGAEEE